MKSPWHLLVIGIVSLIWNAGGAYDYLMTKTGNAAYLEMLTEPQRAMLDAAPVWFTATWAIGVWFSVLGSLLLLLRRRQAVAAFAASLAGLFASAIWSYGIATPPAHEVMGTFAAVFSLVICVVLVALLVYSRTMSARGVLR